MAVSPTADEPGWLAAWLRRPVAVLAWAVALLLAGVWAAFQVPLEWVPQVELPEVRITASWPGASARQVERYVAAPIERAVQTVPGTAHVESLSNEGVANIVLEVADGADLGPYVAQVNERLSLLQDVLPDRVSPRLTKSVPEALRDEQGFITLQLVGPLTPDELRWAAQALRGRRDDLARAVATARHVAGAPALARGVRNRGRAPGLRLEPLRMTRPLRLGDGERRQGEQADQCHELITDSH